MRAAIFDVSSYEGALILRDLLKDICEVEVIGKKEVENGLNDFDIVVFPGGYDHIFAAYRSKKFRESIRNFVGGGGGYLGICGGAYLAGLLDICDCRIGFFGLVLRTLYYSLVGWSKARSPVKIRWTENNIFGRTGEQKIVWACSPYISDSGSFNIEAYYAENKLLVPLKDKGAIATGEYKKGRVILFCPHPELKKNSIDNTNLITKAILWLVFGTPVNRV